ncbi:hypothetical protein ACVWY4_005406 [Bacillus mycoides]
MTKILSLITSVALAGGFLFAPTDNQKEQANQEAPAQQTIMLMSDPGTGV